MTDVKEQQRAMTIHFSLSGRAMDASNQIPDDDLLCKDGVKVLLAKLDSLFLPTKGLRQFAEYHIMHNLRRKPGTSINDFICDFENTYFKFKREGLEIADPCLALQLLSSCALSDDKSQLVMSSVTDDVTYKDVKAALQRIFGHVLAPKGDTSNDQSAVSADSVSFGGASNSEAVIYGAAADGSVSSGGAASGGVLYTSGGRNSYAGSRSSGGQPRSWREGRLTMGRPVGRSNSPPYRRTNPKKDGQITTCIVCRSIYHWARNCPHADERAGGSGAVTRPRSEASVWDDMDSSSKVHFSM